MNLEPSYAKARRENLFNHISKLKLVTPTSEVNPIKVPINNINECDFNIPVVLGLGDGIQRVFAGCADTYDFKKLSLDPSV